MQRYTTGLERAIAGNRLDIAGQSIQRVQRTLQHLREVIVPLHQAGDSLSEADVALKHGAQGKRREMHALNHELVRLRLNGCPSPDLEKATQGIWNWNITNTEGAEQV